MLDATPTYLAFLAVVAVPPTLALVALAAAKSPGGRRLVAVALLTLVALAYTTPWDNELVRRGVWHYGEGTVALRIWHAPLGEYLFVVLQSVAVGLFVSHALARAGGGLDAGAPPVDRRSTARPGPTDVSRRDRALGALAGLGVGGLGLALTGRPSTFYLGATLAWAGPVLALQWAVGWRHLLARRRLVAAGVLVPTAYCWLADRLALELGVWIISPAFTTGVAPGGLPVEEAVFFLLTSLFLTQGLVLYEWVLAGWDPTAALIRVGAIRPRLGAATDRTWLVERWTRLTDRWAGVLDRWA